MHIRNPVEWGIDQIRSAGTTIERVGHRPHDAVRPMVRRITTADLRDALVRGVEDFAAMRSDVAFLCVFYPLAGLVRWLVSCSAMACCRCCSRWLRVSR